MLIKLLSVLTLSFAGALILLGLFTLWLERGVGRWQGITVSLLGLLLAAGYGFLASRFSEALFGRLIVRVDLPALMGTAITYTIGMVGGIAMATALFIWTTGRYQAWQIRRRVLALVLGAVLLTLLLTFTAIWLSRPLP